MCGSRRRAAWPVRGGARLPSHWGRGGRGDSCRIRHRTCHLPAPGIINNNSGNMVIVRIIVRIINQWEYYIRDSCYIQQFLKSLCTLSHYTITPYYTILYYSADTCAEGVLGRQGGVGRRPGLLAHVGRGTLDALALYFGVTWHYHIQYNIKCTVYYL